MTLDVTRSYASDFQRIRRQINRLAVLVFLVLLAILLIEGFKVLEHHGLVVGVVGTPTQFAIPDTLRGHEIIFQVIPPGGYDPDHILAIGGPGVTLADGFELRAGDLFHYRSKDLQGHRVFANDVWFAIQTAGWGLKCIAQS